MATLRDIRSRIGSIKNIQKITQAMKMVATSKFRRAQLSVESSRPYFKILESSINKIIGSLKDDYEHPFLILRKDIKKIALIVISSDQGMCGSFNTNLLKEASNFITQDIAEQYPNAEVSVLPIGRKAISYFSKKNYPIIDRYTQITTHPDYNVVKSIIDPIKDAFESEQLDMIFVSYVKFIHIMRQEPKVIQLMPLEQNQSQNILSKNPSGNLYNDVYIFEPDQNSILDNLIPKLIDSRLWSAILESNASEQAARRVAMDNATANAGELIKALNLIYNKLRQASITSEIIEIVSGAEALKG